VSQVGKRIGRTGLLKYQEKKKKKRRWNSRNAQNQLIDSCDMRQKRTAECNAFPPGSSMLELAELGYCYWKLQWRNSKHLAYVSKALWPMALGCIDFVP
jgi:hypothetical protein